MNRPATRPKLNSPRRLLIVLMTCGFSMTGCGRETKVYPEATAPGATPAPTVTTDVVATLPEGFFDHSVNRGSILLALDGVTDSSVALRLQTNPGANPTGAYNGSGTGNRALLGIALYSGDPLNQWHGLSFDAKVYAGSEAISVSLIADLHCDGQEIRVLTAEGGVLPTSESPTNGYTRFVADAEDEIWTVNGPALVGAGELSDVEVLPSSDGDQLASLVNFIASYPSACFRNAASGDPSLATGVPTSAILLGLGTPDTEDMNGAFVNRVQVGSSVYSDFGHGLE